MHDSVRGNGVQATEMRSLPSIKRVVVEGSIDILVNASADSAQSVRIVADQNLLPLIKTEVHDSTLRIYTDKSYSTKLQITAEMCIPGFSGIAVEGSSTVRAKDIHCSSFEVHIDGSGDVDLRGLSQRLYTEINGSGDIAAANLASDNVQISINGSGDASVQALKRLEVTINGSGDVVYRGNPEHLVQNVNGSGSVTKKP